MELESFRTNPQTMVILGSLVSCEAGLIFWILGSCLSSVRFWVGCITEASFRGFGAM